MPRTRKSLENARSLCLEVPMSTINDCCQMEMGKDLHLMGTVNKADNYSEDIKLCVKKSAHSISFELQAACNGQKFDAVLRESWSCVIRDSAKTNSSKSGKNRKMTVDRTTVHRRSPRKRKIPAVNDSTDAIKNKVEKQTTGDDNGSVHDEGEPVTVYNGPVQGEEDSAIVHDGPVHDTVDQGDQDIVIPAQDVNLLSEKYKNNSNPPTGCNKLNVDQVTINNTGNGAESTLHIKTDSNSDNVPTQTVEKCDIENDSEVSVDIKHKSLFGGNEINPNNLKMEASTFACHFCCKEFDFAKNPLRSLKMHEKQCLMNSSSTKHSTGSDKYRGDTEKMKTSHFIKCGICSAKFNSIESREDHIKRIHERKRATQHPNQCQFCKGMYGSRRAKRRHEIFVCVSNPEVIKPHTCKICRRPFRTEPELSKHFTSKHPDGKAKDESRECDQCGLVFKKTNSLYVHKVTAHNVKEPKFHCPHCSKAFHFRDPYNMHVATHSEARPCLCPICGKCFKNRDQLMKHRKRIHEDKWPYRCQKCGHGMDMKRSLLTHQCSRARRNPDGSHKPNKYPKKIPKIVSRVLVNQPTNKLEDTRVPCAICGKKRKNYDTLLKHMSECHGDEAHYEDEVGRLREKLKVQCDYCLRFFACNKTLVEHQQNVHQTQQSPCTQCTKVFSTPARLKSHMNNVHVNVRYACDQCSGLFKSRKNLLWHVRYHHTKIEKKYKCGICDFRYAFDKQYYEHRMRVHGPKKQVCPCCGYRCATRWYMSKHMKNCSKAEKVQEMGSGESYLAVEEAQTIEIPSDMATAHNNEIPSNVSTTHDQYCLEEVTEVSQTLVQLESGEMIIEQDSMDHKELIAQLTASTLCPSPEPSQQVILRPLDEKAIVELPASWNERTVPENVSVESIIHSEDNKATVEEQLNAASSHVQEYRITQPDGSEHIIQLVYRNQHE